MRILYITYVPSGSMTSGSSVRPTMMYQAMLSCGHEVYIVEGSQERQERKNRRSSVRNAYSWMNTTVFDFCYIESPTYPIMYRFDISLIRAVLKNSIPTAYFYRDCYLRFPHFGRETRRPFIRYLKDFYLRMLQYRTDKLLQQVDIVYFPSQKMADLFDYRNRKILMPAGVHHQNLQHQAEEKTCIYVGGLSEDYGSNMMLEAFKRLNQAETYKLILVCRKEEYFDSAFYKEKPEGWGWLQVVHTSNREELLNLYSRASLALLPQKPGDYIDMAVAVKFFEYLSYDLPIVSAGAHTMSCIVRENNLGVVTSFSPIDFAFCIKALFQNKTKILNYRNSIQVYMESNTWTKRIEQMIGDLMLTGER